MMFIWQFFLLYSGQGPSYLIQLCFPALSTMPGINEYLPVFPISSLSPIQFTFYNAVKIIPFTQLYFFSLYKVSCFSLPPASSWASRIYSKLFSNHSAISLLNSGIWDIFLALYIHISISIYKYVYMLPRLCSRKWTLKAAHLVFLYVHFSWWGIHCFHLIQDLKKSFN